MIDSGYHLYSSVWDSTNSHLSTNGLNYVNTVLEHVLILNDDDTHLFDQHSIDKAIYDCFIFCYEPHATA